MGTNESPTKKDTIARTSTVPTYTLETLTNNYFAIPPTDQHPLLYGLSEPWVQPSVCGTCTSAKALSYLENKSLIISSQPLF